ncbi:hypothetical protein [Tahibacter sp.]|uniref:hypothetical protein n=1 Tax=Tahibacter sp. TaxID=2056211 RepID=UPI0028C446D0|nr:hypothetical protein [Tahibacter sp.]
MTATFVPSSPRSHAFVGAVLGLLIGLSLLICVVLLDLAASDVLELVDTTNDARTRVQRVGLPSLLAAGWPWLYGGLAVALLTAGGTMAGLLVHWSHLDADHFVGASLRRASRALTASWPVTITLVLPAAMLSVMHARSGSDVLLALLVYTELLALLLMLSFYSPRNTRDNSGVRWWLPQWPGWRRFLIALLMMTATTGIQLAISGHLDELPPAFEITLELVFLALQGMLGLMAASVLLLGQLPWSLLLGRRMLGAWYVSGIVIVALLTPFVFPMVAHNVFSVFLQPQIDSSIAAGADLQRAQQIGWLLRHVGQATGTIAICLFVPLWGLTGARLVILCRGEESNFRLNRSVQT